MENSFAKFIKIFAYFGVPILIAVLLYTYLHAVFFSPADQSARKSTLVEIQPSMSFRDISDMLEDKGVLRSARSLILFARLKGITEPVRAGEYVLSASMTPKQLLDILVSGRVFERSVRVDEGGSVWDIGAKLQEAGIIDKSEFDPWLTNPELLAKTGISAPSFEGYLAPGLYEFSKPISGEKIAWTMIERSEKDWPQDYSVKAEELRMSRHEILTLASILERETQDSGERRLLSSVFHNRLQNGMKLESDATVAYGIRDFQGQLTDDDRSSPSPFNTYINFGLPPGPICNPGKDAIVAALFPEDTAYLFFSREIDGRLMFAETQKEFNQMREKQLELLTGE